MCRNNSSLMRRIITTDMRKKSKDSAQDMDLSKNCIQIKRLLQLLAFLLIQTRSGLLKRTLLQLKIVAEMFLGRTEDLLDK